MNQPAVEQSYYKIIFLMCGMAAASIGICQNTPGVFYTAVSESIGVMRGTFAMHATLSLFGIAVTSLCMPRILKQFPIKPIVVSGTIIMAASTAAMSFSNQITSFYLLAILRGFGAGLCANVPITMIINQWFVAKNGQATSIALSFSGLAGAVCSPIFARCIEIWGWRSAYLLQSGILVAFMLPCVLIPFHIDPHEESLQPYGGEPVAKKATDVDRPFDFLSVRFFCIAIFTLYQSAGALATLLSINFHSFLKQKSSGLF